MYKIIFSLALLCSLSVTAMAQEKEEGKVSHRRIGLQLSPLGSGAWIYHESRLSDQFSLRTEIGLEGSLYLTKEDWIGGYQYRPVINLEPRWYYNLNKRLSRGKVIAGNSGNFFAIRVNYLPKIFTVNGGDFSRSNPHAISFTPVWGIRRKLGRQFYWEASGGVGLEIGNIGMGETAKPTTAVKPYLNLRIGYDL